MKYRELPITMLAVVLVLAATGCQIAAPNIKVQPGGLAKEDIALTQNQIRLRVRAMVGPMCGEIEQAADYIAAGTTSHDLKRAALEWKIEAVPTMRGAIFQPDPLTALMDTWVLCNQMADYFETGPGKAALGNSSPTAVATCRRLEETVAQVAATMTVSGDVSKLRALVRQWAADHPIKNSIAGRESFLSHVLDRNAREALSAGEVVADVTTAVEDLSRKLDVYTEQLVRQARWEAELFKSEILADVPVNQALPLAERTVRTAEQAAATLDRLAPAVERGVVVAESAPKVIASEREAATKLLQEELARMSRFAREERIATLAYLSQERIATLKELEQILEHERKGVTEDLYRISVKMVDHAIWRVAQLCVLILVALFIGVVLLLLLRRRLCAPVQHPNKGMENFCNQKKH
jgi:hypothetical protein